jgi:hypothetical protein
VKLSAEERKEKYLSLRFDDRTAGFMTMIEGLTASGHEDFMNSSVEEITGKKPQSLIEWVEENKSVW